MHIDENAWKIDILGDSGNISRAQRARNFLRSRFPKK